MSRRDLEGAVALVTGSGAGIGAGIADVLAARGATVAVNDLDPAAADRTVARIEAAGGAAHAIAGDVSIEADVRAMTAFVTETLGGLDVLVNNAGIGNPPTPFEEAHDDDMASRWAVNVAGPFRCIRAALDALTASNAGRVINVGSRSWLGARGFADYSATKGAVASLTRTLAIELGPRGVTVNAVIPGSIVTPAFEAMPEAARADVLDRHPARRFGTPADVGRAVAFFASPAARAATGQLLHVCGGRSLYGG